MEEVTKNNITRKVLLNPETNKRYKRGDLILEGKFKGKVFLTYRFDRPLRWL